MSVGVTVLSGKGGSGKSACQLLLTGEASRAGLRCLIVDVDPERNMSNRFGVSQHSTGLGNAFDEAGVLGGGEVDRAAGGAQLKAELVSTPWEGVDLIPAGARLGAISQVAIEDTWLFADMLESSGLSDAYDVIFFDTAGRTGSLVTQAMYAATVAYAPIAPTMDAVRKALEAKERVTRIQRAHSLRWAGVILSGFDRRIGMDEAIRAEASEQFGDEVRAEVPRRAAVHESFQLCERLGDRNDVAAAGLAGEFRRFLFSDLLKREEQTS